LTIWERAQGGEHPAVAQANHNLAVLYIAAQRFEEAERCLFAARKLLERVGERARPHLVTVFKTFATLYKNMGRIGESKEYTARAENILKPKVPRPGVASSVPNH